MQIIYLVLFRRFVISILPYFAATPNYRSAITILGFSCTRIEIIHSTVTSEVLLCYFVTVVPFKKFLIFWVRNDFFSVDKFWYFEKGLILLLTFTRSLFWSGLFCRLKMLNVFPLLWEYIHIKFTVKTVIKFCYIIM